MVSCQEVETQVDVHKASDTGSEKPLCRVHCKELGILSGSTSSTNGKAKKSGTHKVSRVVAFGVGLEISPSGEFSFPETQKS